MNPLWWHAQTHRTGLQVAATSPGARAGAPTPFSCTDHVFPFVRTSRLVMAGSTPGDSEKLF